MPQTVLVIDDNDMIRGVASRLLCGAGFTTLLAPDAETGLRLLDARAVDIVVVDLVMPAMWGDEFVRRVRLHRDPVVRRTLVLGLSGSHKDAEAMFASAGATASVSKPLQHEHLLSAVRRLLGEAGPTGARVG